jgi:Probable cobalt transporter subunit (CbtA)
MIRTLFLRGLVAGLIAGLAAGGFAFAFGEPLIDRAIAVEEVSEPAGHAEEALVSRDGQRVGLFLATGIYGLALGGLFGLVFAFARGRVRARSDLWLSVGLAATLFAAVVLVPLVNYPAAPPGVGDPATITERTLLYLTVVVTSLLALLAAWRVARSVPENAPSWLRPVASLAVFAATAATVAYVLPAVDEAPESFPSDLLWDFRLTSLGVQAVLWTSLGLAFGIGVRRARLGARTG